jgi:hypothetical protein
MTMALEEGEGSASPPNHSLPPGKTRYPLYRRLGGPQGRSRQVRKISPPTVFDPWAVQPVASRYTDYTTRFTSFYVHAVNPTLVFKISKGIMHYVGILCNTVSVIEIITEPLTSKTCSIGEKLVS